MDVKVYRPFFFIVRSGLKLIKKPVGCNPTGFSLLQGGNVS